MDTAESDSRVEGDSLTAGPIPPGGPSEGIVVFSNVPFGPTDYRLLFTPPGAGRQAPKSGV